MKKKGQLEFRFNLKSISQNIANVKALDNEANLHTYIIYKRGNSNYINDILRSNLQHFTGAEIQTVVEVGHWLHNLEFFEMTIPFVSKLYNEFSTLISKFYKV